MKRLKKVIFKKKKIKSEREREWNEKFNLETCERQPRIIFSNIQKSVENLKSVEIVKRKKKSHLETEDQSEN